MQTAVPISVYLSSGSRVTLPDLRPGLGLEYSLVEFENWTPRPQWFVGVKRLRIGQPAWKHVDRAVAEYLVGTLDE